jgi:hypothetical protein
VLRLTPNSHLVGAKMSSGSVDHDVGDRNVNRAARTELSRDWHLHTLLSTISPRIEPVGAESSSRWPDQGFRGSIPQLLLGQRQVERDQGSGQVAEHQRPVRAGTGRATARLLNTGSWHQIAVEVLAASIRSEAASALSGRPRRKPWPNKQPISASASSWYSSSIPSATT